MSSTEGEESELDLENAKKEKPQRAKDLDGARSPRCEKSNTKRTGPERERDLTNSRKAK